MLRSLYPLESSVGLGAHRERPPHTAPSRAAQNSMAWPRPLSTTDPADFSDDSAVLLWSDVPDQGPSRDDGLRAVLCAARISLRQGLCCP